MKTNHARQPLTHELPPVASTPGRVRLALLTLLGFVAIAGVTSALAYSSSSDTTPPPGGEYRTPDLATYHAAYPNGTIVNNPIHYAFSGGGPPPPSGSNVVHTFSSVVDFTVFPNGLPNGNRQRAPAQVVVRMQHVADNNGIRVFQTEMLQLDIAGGTLPANVRMRESPTLASTGMTTIQPTATGFEVQSFFDIFTEMSTDGGATWMASITPPVRMELTGPAEVFFLSDVCPPARASFGTPPNDPPVSFANGAILLRNIRHSLLNNSIAPPGPGGNATYTAADTLIELEFSSNGGTSYTPGSGPATVSASIRHGFNSSDTRFFDTEMLALTVSGGTFAAGSILRESPTLASVGRHSIRAVQNGYRHMSYFDVFLELSIDNGATWFPADRAVRVEQTGPFIGTIPTLSEWGLIVMALLLLTVGTVFLLRQQPRLATTSGQSRALFGWQNTASLFVPGVFVQVLSAVLALAALGLAGTIGWRGFVSTTDIVGTLISAVIAAYWLHLLVAQRHAPPPRR